MWIHELSLFFSLSLGSAYSLVLDLIIRSVTNQIRSSNLLLIIICPEFRRLQFWDERVQIFILSIQFVFFGSTNLIDQRREIDFLLILLWLNSNYSDIRKSLLLSIPINNLSSILTCYSSVLQTKRVPYRTKPTQKKVTNLMYKHF